MDLCHDGEAETLVSNIMKSAVFLGANLNRDDGILKFLTDFEIMAQVILFDKRLHWIRKNQQHTVSHTYAQN